MRGLGIILVVVGHLWRWPPGVYAMLDMFFVLSGFLITAILIRALPKYGAQFLVVFALSRVRRLMPASVAIVALTVALTYAIYSSTRGDLVAQDGMWALLLAVNWHFALSGTDYFNNDLSGSPLLHYWSLSVEEQFYAVWPFFLLVLIVTARRLRTSQVALVAIGMAAMTLVAFGYSMWHSVQAPTSAYFSTLDRAWEFGIGGLIALAAPRLAKLPLWCAATMSWGGTIGLIVTLFALPYGVPFPAPFGLFPSLLTGVIIIGGIDRDTRYIPLLDNRVMIYLGDLSYSIYLCHLPVNVLLRPFFPEMDSAYYVGALVATALTSAGAYYLVEKPMRDAPWLMTRPERARLAASRRRRSGRWQVRHRDGILIAATLVTALLCAVALRPPSSESARGDQFASGLPQVSGAGPTLSPAMSLHREKLIDALTSTEFPEFEPPLDAINLEDFMTAAADYGCTQVVPSSVDNCTFGDAAAPREAVVIGDSYAIAWMPAIRILLQPRGWRIRQLTFSQCPSWTLPDYVMGDGSPFPECKEHHDFVEREVRRQRPDLLILATASAHVRNIQRPGFAKDPVGLARDSLLTTLRQLAPLANHTAVLQPPPPHVNLVTCVNRVSSPSACESEPDEEWRNHAEGEEAAAQRAAATYISTLDWFCVSDKCPAFFGRTPITMDGAHLSFEYASILAPLLGEALRAVLRPQRHSAAGRSSSD